MQNINDITTPPHPARNNNNNNMPPIDLTLAVNYIPAVVCLGKASLISCCLCILNPGTHLGGFIIFALLLNIDRAVSSSRIFDENAVQLCILSAWIINYLRVASEAPIFVNPLVSSVWLLFSLVLVLEFRKVQEFFVLYGQGSGGSMQKLIPAIFTSCMVGLLSSTPVEVESGVVRSCRAVGFASLCVAWVYVVTVWRCKPRHSACVFETHALVARFCPLLYVHRLLALGFAVVCLACISYHYVLIHVEATRKQYSRVSESKNSEDCDNNIHSITNNNNICKPSPLSLQVPVLDLQNNHKKLDIVDEEDDEALEAYFRTACQNNNKNSGDGALDAV